MTAKDKEKFLDKEYGRLKAEYDKLLESNNVLNQRVLELYTLYNVSKTLSMSLELNELFDMSIKVIGESIRVEKYFLMLLDKETDKLVIRASHGMQEEELVNGVVALGEGACGKAAEAEGPVMVPDIAAEKDFFLFPGVKIGKGSFLGVPLRGQDASPIGLLCSLKPQPDGFSEEESRLFEAVADHVAIAIEKALAFQQTQELMSRDELTNLHNRRYFFERFEREVYRAERYDRSLSLLMIDIDHFKNFNDTFGHLRGDQALKRLARLLEGQLRKADVVARYGGEEFLVLLPETEKKSASIVGEKLREAVAQVDFNDDDSRYESAPLTITVGVSNMPEDGAEPLELMDLADKALYYGKAQGRNQVCTEVPQKGAGK